MLEQRPPCNLVPASSDPAPSCSPNYVSPSLSPEPNLVLDSDLTYENWEDPVLASLH